MFCAHPSVLEPGLGLCTGRQSLGSPSIPGSTQPKGGPQLNDAGSDAGVVHAVDTSVGAPAAAHHSPDTLLPHARTHARTHRAAGRMEVIEAVRQSLNSMNLKQSESAEIEVLAAIGEGSHGKVYKGLCEWFVQRRRQSAIAPLSATLECNLALFCFIVVCSHSNSLYYSSFTP